MNQRSDDNGERARRLMMAALDGELSPEEQSELERVLESDPELRREWKELQGVKEVTGTMGYREPPEEIWDEYWTSIYSRVERGIGWILVSLGALVVFGWGMWVTLEAVFHESEIPLVVKAGIFATVFGVGVLLLSVIREKFFTRRRDPYREVQR